MFHTFLALIFSGYVLAQIPVAPEILATGYSPFQDDLRALLIRTQDSSVTDLGFNGSFLPVWKGDSILVSTSGTIWLVNSDGEKMKKLYSGSKIYLSPSRAKALSFSRNGVIVYNFLTSSAKEILIAASPETALTWLPGENAFTYFDPERRETFICHYSDDAVEQFGRGIVQPVWSPDGSMFVYQKFSDGRYSIYLSSGSVPLPSDKKIPGPAGNDLVPVFSNTSQSIYYLKLPDNPQMQGNTTAILSELWEYNIKKNQSSFLYGGAVFTDGFYPQFCLSKNDKIVYFSVFGINRDEIVPSALEIETKKFSVFSSGFYKDVRFPLVNNTKQ